MMTEQDRLKKISAEKAVESIRSGMLIGLGVGSTSDHAVRKIAELLKTGKLKDIKAVVCSKATEDLASSLGIPLTSLKKNQVIDVTIDGADEVDRDLNLIKGGGGALLREKIVAQATNYQIIVVDDSKISVRLGEKFPLPIEVLQFGWQSHYVFLIELGGKPVLRHINTQTPFLTDQGNYIIDCDFGPMTSPHSLALKLDQRAGIIEHGLFLEMANEVIVASPDGIKTLKR